MATNRTIFLILLIISAFSFIFIDTAVGLAGIILCLLLPLASLCLFLAATKGLNIMLSLPATIQENSEAELIIKVNKPTTLQLARISLNINVFNSLSENQISKTLEIKRLQHKNENISFKLSAEDFGKLRVSVLKAYAFDSLGLFRKKLPDIPESSMLILPKLFDVDIVNQPKVEITDEGQVYSQHKPGRDNTEIFAMHQYVPGDDIRKIHWKLSSKSDELMVRDFSLPLNYSLFLLLELPKGKAEPSTFPAAVKLILSLSYALNMQQMGHSIGWFDTKASSLITREILSDEDISFAVSELVSLSGTEDAFGLQNLAEGNFLPANAFVYYITPAPDEDMLAAFADRYNVTLLIPPKEKIVTNYIV